MMNELNTYSLTDFQLYELKQNNAIRFEIQEAVNLEFVKRDLSHPDLVLLKAKHEELFPKDSGSLNIKYKLLLILTPFVLVPYYLVVHCIVSSFLNPHKAATKKREYWFLVGLSHAIWTIVILAYAKFHFSMSD
jgi:hypothetical protein